MTHWLTSQQSHRVLDWKCCLVLVKHKLLLHHFPDHKLWSTYVSASPSSLYFMSNINLGKKNHFTLKRCGCFIKNPNHHLILQTVALFLTTQCPTGCHEAMKPSQVFQSTNCDNQNSLNSTETVSARSMSHSWKFLKRPQKKKKKREKQPNMYIIKSTFFNWSQKTMEKTPEIPLLQSCNCSPGKLTGTTLFSLKTKFPHLHQPYEQQHQHMAAN